MFTSFRVTQLYETCGCIYIYFGFSSTGMSTEEYLHKYDLIETAARKEIMRNGGSISHHHGIGKIRKKFVRDSQPEITDNALRALKKELDPKNVFAINNIIDF